MQSLTVPVPPPASARFFKMCARVLQPVQMRHESTYRRSRSKLNIKPDPNFLPTKTEQHDHIIYNPPPSMPNVYHTPTIFLPKDDKRRAIQASLQPYSQAQLSADFIPAVKQPYEKRYHLTKDDVEEMRKLRDEDPVKWSQSALARKFDCSNAFVGFVIKGMSKEKAKQQQAVNEVIRSNWGVKRRTAREDRAIRKERWYRDE
ncbi:uncharacterized protein HMPREF1541_07544 [Cyphellophora europaea CBS 101466]|uniref:Uncharacterized protein n=1 Tax=Cyphellophora europaea (strain CBS 101466) TaxID=1220924 RepID=W2RN54_CYPE1|nr:uncharacterized protein HMPREF1541_07544 [Cyphellophora europaea CBS 101466]ETN37921.1 hypothetical protein HMPREF1541_07544 [Cyphellophora europaea CBS 101466]